MKVVEFPGKNWRDIPKCLRQLADEIEGGSHGEVKSFAAVMEGDGEIALIGYGEADPPRSLGLFVIGQSIITGGFVEE